MPEPGNRLLTAASLVRSGSVVADIGTDHAYLPIYLIKNSIASKVLACDLREGPLDNARENVIKAGCENEIILRLSDGLDKIAPVEADDIIICGMGGTLIADILSRTEWLKDSHYRLILQPQSHSDDLRKYLFTNGFIIENEISVSDEGRDYSILKCRFADDYSDKDNLLKIHFGSLIDNPDEISKRTVKRHLDYLKVRRKSEKEFGSIEIYETLDKIITEAEDKLNES